MGKKILRALLLKTAVSRRPTIFCKVPSRRRWVSLVGASRNGLESSGGACFKGFLDVFCDLDFLFVTHQVKEEMLKGMVVEEGSGLARNDSEVIGFKDAFVPGNVDQLLESGQSGMQVKDSPRSG